MKHNSAKAEKSCAPTDYWHVFYTSHSAIATAKNGSKFHAAHSFMEFKINNLTESWQFILLWVQLI